MAEDNYQKGIGTMTMTQLQALVGGILEERVGILESLVEGQAINVNDVDKKITSFLAYMPSDLDRERDMAEYIKEVVKQHCGEEVQTFAGKLDEFKAITEQKIKLAEEGVTEIVAMRIEEAQDQGGGGKVPAQELRKQITDLDFFWKGKFLDVNRKIAKLEMACEPVSGLMKESTRTVEELALKADLTAVEAIKDRLTTDHPTLKQFAQLQNTVTMKAEWDDHNDLVKVHHRTREKLEDTAAELEKLKRSYLEFSAAQISKSEAMGTETEAINQVLKALQQKVKKTMNESQS